MDGPVPTVEWAGMGIAYTAGRQVDDPVLIVGGLRYSMRGGQHSYHFHGPRTSGDEDSRDGYSCM